MPRIGGADRRTRFRRARRQGLAAFPLADAAAEAEKTLPSDKGATLAALERIKGKSAAVHLFIEEFLKGGD